MLYYEYDRELLTIEEQSNGQDVEFRMKLHRPDAGVEKAVKRIRDYFDDNDVITDVLFYAHEDGEYQWIVRHDFYEDFVISLFRHRLVQRMAWEQ
ncbi:hypothetical protein NLX71_11540 [Paenibacillus sp. MZ04-78.2]|uniref:hypothetical protein n=1 Tax=Paenibacillus sp. MZ04-78.2 TaxID=2962034 RepID=UPI0020B892C0|nr:hypothetical protein [Paenibacillus sp. MZ04-78.2]MCP3773933.1 hypothetical protein [Paenibacillus sp. MZ04-78.2]